MKGVERVGLESEDDDIKIGLLYETLKNWEALQQNKWIAAGALSRGNTFFAGFCVLLADKGARALTKRKPTRQIKPNRIICSV